ncbi:M23 family metallopeptidase [bacterium]|nr:M23 family metallopeptidase [bacterium]
MLSTIVILVAAAALIASSATRCWRMRQAPHDWDWRTLAQAAPGITAAVFAAIALALGAGLFFQGTVVLAIDVLAIVLVLTSVAETVVAMRFGPPAQMRRKKLIASSAAAAIGLFILAFVCFLRTAPSTTSAAIRLDLPVHGEWRVVTGGRTGLTNYHHNNPRSQSYAVDIVSAAGPSEGRPIFAPCNGRTVRAVIDQAPGGASPEGNYVIIEAADGTQIWMAHFRQGSVRVHENDIVKKGQQIAECGSTGSADEAHLHIHAQRNDDPVPMLFGEKKAFLLRNDRLP